MDIGAAIKYPFSDRGWLGKLVVGSLFWLLPIIGWIVWVGYILEVVREVSTGKQQGLPPWGNLGEYFTRGFVGTVAALAYITPGLILYGCASSVLAVGGGSGTGSDLQQIAAGVGALVLVLVYFVMSLITGAAFTVGFVRYATTEKAGSFIDLGTTVSLVGQHIGTVFGTILITWLGVTVITLGGYLFIWTLCIPLLVISYAYLVAGHMLGGLAVKLDLAPKLPGPTDVEVLV